MFGFSSLLVAETNILGSRETADLYEQRKREPLWAGIMSGKHRRTFVSGKRRTFVGRETADLYQQGKGGPLLAGKRRTFVGRETAGLYEQRNGEPLWAGSGPLLAGKRRTFTSKMIRDGGNYEAYRLCMTPWTTPYIFSWRGNKLEETNAF
jgi:hypothetical protein